ncbi:hypothetical protein [Burkholderia anthina]|uniref:hypothetical protein n=1 Tax=Burkholderia anthina TaxID=179879 RepID=UPI001FC843B0|nr:hypothetical protein [Burkholderia anthina]
MNQKRLVSGCGRHDETIGPIVDGFDPDVVDERGWVARGNSGFVMREQASLPIFFPGLKAASGILPNAPAIRLSRAPGFGFHLSMSNSTGFSSYKLECAC